MKAAQREKETVSSTCNAQMSGKPKGPFWSNYNTVKLNSIEIISKLTHDRLVAFYDHDRGQHADQLQQWAP